MKVMAYDPYVKEVPEEFKSFVTLNTIDEIVKAADIISMHLPLTDETRNMISAKEMADVIRIRLRTQSVKAPINPPMKSLC